MRTVDALDGEWLSVGKNLALAPDARRGSFGAKHVECTPVYPDVDEEDEEEEEDDGEEEEVGGDEDEDEEGGSAADDYSYSYEEAEVVRWEPRKEPGCGCTGHKNAHGFGGFCKAWEEALASHVRFDVALVLRFDAMYTRSLDAMDVRWGAVNFAFADVRFAEGIVSDLFYACPFARLGALRTALDASGNTPQQWPGSAHFTWTHLRDAIGESELHFSATRPTALAQRTSTPPADACMQHARTPLAPTMRPHMCVAALLPLLDSVDEQRARVHAKVRPSSRPCSCQCCCSRDQSQSDREPPQNPASRSS